MDSHQEKYTPKGQKKMKKFLAIVFALIFALSACTVAFAEEAKAFTCTICGLKYDTTAEYNDHYKVCKAESDAAKANAITSITLQLKANGEVVQEVAVTEKENWTYTFVELNKYDENGNLIETDKRTNLWAWKHPHKADGTTTYTELKGDIQMTDVDFGYVPERIVLKNVTLTAAPGQKIAFVGATGAGKTTITNLINRFYDIADGKMVADTIKTPYEKRLEIGHHAYHYLKYSNNFAIPDVDVDNEFGLRVIIRYSKKMRTTVCDIEIDGKRTMILMTPNLFVDTVNAAAGSILDGSLYRIKN